MWLLQQWSQLLLSCLVQSPHWLSILSYSPGCSFHYHRKGHVSSLIPAKIDPVWLPLKLQLYLILTSGPGNSSGKKSCVSSGWRNAGISTDLKVFIPYLEIGYRVEDLTSNARALKLSSRSPACALLLIPEIAGSAIHMDAFKEGTEELWHFQLNLFGCAWSTCERHPLIPCWNTGHSEEETEQQNACNTFLLEHPAAETRPGSTGIFSWIKGIKFQWTPRCCPSAWMNVDEPKYSGMVKTPVAVRGKDSSLSWQQNMHTG